MAETQSELRGSRVSVCGDYRPISSEQCLSDFSSRLLDLQQSPTTIGISDAFSRGLV